MVAKCSTITIGKEPHACIEIENHATFYRWSSLLVAWIVGACPPTMTMTISSNMVAILQLIVRLRHAYIGHPCYGQLTPVKRRYPLIILRAQV